MHSSHDRIRVFTQRLRAPLELGRQRGSAVVGFVLVLLLLIPLFLGVFQVGLVLHVRNTATACASEGARYGANLDRDVTDGSERARECMGTSLSSKWASDVSADLEMIGGNPVVVVRANATVPALGLWGSLVEVDVAGHAVKER